MKKKNLLLTFLITLSFILIGGRGVKAQTTILIGSGNTSSSYQITNYPTYVKAKNAYSQQIFTSDEIGGFGTITSIAFYPANNNCTRELEIYLVSTTKSTFTDSSDWISISGLTPVFSGNVTFTTSSWNTITLDNSFEYSENNIAVIVYDKTGSAESTDTKFLYDFNFPTNTCLHKNGESIDPSSPGTGYRARKNQIKLSIAYLYPKPTELNINSLTNETASISWTAPTATTGHTLDGYQYRIKEGNGSFTDPAETTNPCNLSNLEGGSTYTFQVRAIYTDSSKETHYSFWAETTFTTECNEMEVPTTTWGFEGSDNMPDCWKITASSSNYPTILNNTTYAHSGSRSLQFNYAKNTALIVLMPAIDETLNGKTLSFYARKHTDDLYTYNIIVGYYDSNNVFVAPEGSTITITNSAYSNEDSSIGYYEYDITNFPNEIRKVAIKCSISNQYSSLYLDDVKIDYTTSCTPVSSPTVGTVTYNSAQLSWTAGDETNWKLQYRVSGEEDWTTVNVSSANLSAGVYTLSGLSENTTYEWQVAAWCDTSDDDEISTYVAGEDFSTPAQYPMPTGLAADNITANSADITWTAGSTETAWQLYYTPYDYATPGSASPGDYINISTTPAYSMTGLTRNTTYYVYVRANYGDGHYSSWTAAEDFTTECGTFALPYSYDFEDADELNCWTIRDAHPSTGINEAQHHSGENSFTFFSSNSNPTQYLITPELTSTDFGVHVELYLFATSKNAKLRIGYSTTNNLAESFTWDSEKNSTAYNWVTYSYNCPPNTKFVAIRFDQNTTAWIDDISLTAAYDKVFNRITDNGLWTETYNWNPAGEPGDTQSAFINGAATISGGIATASNITVGANGSLTIADGGQLVCNNNPTVTMQKNICSWGSKSVGGWSFIASPIAGSIDPQSAGLITDDLGSSATAETATYDLYRLDVSQDAGWRNYRQHDFSLTNGMGYLYASKEGTTLSFSGNIQPSNENVTVGSLNEGYNLVGNPYTCNAYINRNYYMLVDGSTVSASETSKATPIAPCTGVVVESVADGSVTFSKTAPDASANNGNLQMVLAQSVATRGESAVQTLDKAIVSFNEGSQLGKFYFGTQDANLYIPQDNEEYAIVSSSAQGEMPVNFKAHRDGQYTITVNPEEVEMGYLHLIDNIAGKEVDLLANPSYTFNAKADDYESRFRLVFSANMVNADLNDDFAFFSNGQLVIANEGEAILQVIDVTGRVVATESVNGTCSKAVNVKAGVYVLRLINGTNVKTQKIIVK